MMSDTRVVHVNTKEPTGGMPRLADASYIYR
jgi:hypothetical protein